MKFININTGKLLLIASFFISMGSCKKDNFLSVPPNGTLTDVSTFSSQGNAELFLNDIYSTLPDFYGTDRVLDAFADNSNSGATGHDAQAIVRSNALSPGNSTDGPEGFFRWSDNYGKIRRCNVFLKDAAANAKAYDPAWYAQRVAETKFLRAFFYTILYKNYGALPLITKPLNNQDGTDIFTARATPDATLAFIVADCDSAAAVLPLTQKSAADLGRATKGAALALKADVQLFAASPLLNTSNDLTKWATAAATNLAIMNLGIYGLFKTDGPTPILSTTGSGTIHTAFRDLFLAANNWNNETIFVHPHALPKSGHSHEGRVGPVNVNGHQQSWGGLAPTQSLVDDYQMDNGKPITDPTSGYDPQHPYLHRESRFEQSIVYDGSYYQGDIFMSRIGGANEIDLGSKSDVSNTGYNARKTLDESITGQASFGTSPNTSNYYYYRYAEILLSYAEAQNEAVGPDLSVYNAVNMIRARGFLPPVPPGTSQSDMRTIIRRERRIELAFEDKRWYDIRRWDITVKGPAVLNTPEMGMLITPTGGNLVYTPTLVFSNKFSEYMNWLPIPSAVILSNPKLVQNPGY